MSTEHIVSEHYTHGALEQEILAALAKGGTDPDRLAPADLAPIDEFHIGGRQATIDFANQMVGIRPGMHLLDIGSGLGGASRYFAHEAGCRVTGIDLTEEYVRVAEALSKRTGLGGSISYRQASAVALPFPDGTFDGAYMLHVGMNIPDKVTAFSEARRVLKHGGVFGIYDVMREDDGPLTFPVPWASSLESSFVERLAAYRKLLVDLGFEILSERSRREFGIEFFRQLRERVAQSGPPLLGLQILMGGSAPQKMANMAAMLERGLISPTEIIGRAN